MSLQELMEMHRQIFRIKDNLHDFFCRGCKDYEDALGNVNDFNMTKVFTSKCSIPTGDYKDARCEIQLIGNILQDVYLYNYADVAIR